MANPACIKKTKKADISVQIVSIATALVVLLTHHKGKKVKHTIKVAKIKSWRTNLTFSRAFSFSFPKAKAEYQYKNSARYHLDYII
jgi:hypothetical protein